MGAEATLKMLLLGEDRGAAKVIKNVGDEAEHSSTRMHSFGKAAAIGLGAVVGAAGIAGAAAVDFGKKSVDAYKEAAAESGQLSRVTGMTIQQASQLRFAGEETGVSFSSLAKGMQIFSKNQSAAADGLEEYKVKALEADRAGKPFTGRLTGIASTFAKLGFATTDAAGKALPMQQVLGQLADQFKTMPDGPEKTALAMKLFGKGGADMIKTLNKGSEGLKELAAESDKTGNTLQNTDAYKKQLVAQREYHASITGLKVQVGQALMPALAGLAEFMAHNVGPAFTAASGWVTKHGDTIRQVFGNIIGFVKTPVMIIVGFIKANWGSIRAWTLQTFDSIKQIIAGVLQIIQILWHRYGNNILAYVKSAWKLIGGVISGALSVIKGVINVVLGILTGNWSKAWLGIKQILGGVWHAIVSVLQGALGMFKAAFTAGLSTLWSLVKGIPGGILKAIGNVNQILYDKGVAIVQGLLDGAGSLLSTIGDWFLNKIPGWIRGAFKKAMGIASPSKVFRGYGINIMEGLIQGLGAGQMPLKAAMGKISDYIKAQGQKIAGLMSAKKDVISSMLGFGSSVFGASFTDDQGNATTPTSGGLVNFQQGQLDQARQLNSDVKTLVKAGLSKGLIQQMIGAGASGIANIHALATGPVGDIKQLNTLTAQTNAALASAGKTAGGALYNDQIATAEKNRSLAQEIRHQLEKWSHNADKNTIIHFHLEGRTIQMSLLELKRRNGNRALGLT